MLETKVHLLGASFRKILFLPLQNKIHIFAQPFEFSLLTKRLEISRQRLDVSLYTQVLSCLVQEGIVDPFNLCLFGS